MGGPENITEEKISAALKERFPFIGADDVRVVRPRRVSVRIDSARMLEVMEYMRRELDLGTLHSMTGLDAVDRYQVLYYLSYNYGIVVTLTTDVPKENPSVDSVTDMFPGAEFYEREIVDVLGIEVKGLPPGNRYPLSDDWPEGEYPLRKDWKGEGGDTTPGENP